MAQNIPDILFYHKIADCTRLFTKNKPNGARRKEYHMKNMLIIDGNSILNRQFYGIRPLTTSGGLFTNAVYGFMNVLLSELEALAPEYAAVAFDVHAPTFRHKAFTDYKAGRHATPPELLMQFPYAKRLASAMGISVLEKEGFEADDILGTLARMGRENDVGTYILTGDRDSLQLIGDRCTVLLASNGGTQTFDGERFYEKYGITPDRFVDMKALMGDSSDNIPGVPGIGEKTASKLIAEWGDIDNLYANLDKIKKGKMLENLENGKESAYMSKFLAKIVDDVPLDIGNDLGGIRRGEIDKPTLRSLFGELEFTGFSARMKLDTDDCPDAPDETELTVKELAEKDFSGRTALLLGDGSAKIADANGQYTVNFAEPSELYDFFDKDGREFVLYDCKSVFHKLHRTLNCTYDVLLAAYVLSPTDANYDTDRLGNLWLGSPVRGASDLLRLAEATEAKLRELSMYELFRSVEMPLATVLYRMEERGMLIDRAGLEAFSKELEESIKEDSAKIYEIAGHDFNISSPKQLATVLFDELGLPVFKKTKSGYSTNAEVLEKLFPYHPIIGLVLDYRQVTKLKSTYADGLPAAADADDRIRTSFNQTVTATGRLSSTEPNLQNIPIRTELGSRMRGYFPAPHGRLLVDADYSQIELRLLAHISGDPLMIRAFVEGADIHTATAAQVFGVDEADVTPEMRKRAKAVNFGIVYGIGDYSLSQDLGITKKQAADYIRAYKSKYIGVEEYLSATVEQAYRNGYVVTMSGRRRYIPELSSPKASVRSFGERVAMNSPIQGSAADIIKIAMIRVEKALEESGLDAKLIMQVHDELIIEADEKDAVAAAAILKREMESAASLSVPLTADVNIGRTWLECH